MSKVEELLAKYNPEGVDNIPLWELTAWDKKFNAVDKSMQKKVIKYKYYLAKDLDALVDDTGDIRILYTNEKVAYTSEEKCKGNICEGEIVAIPWGGTPTVKYYNGKFVTGDNRIATSLDTKILNNKYLFYWMISQLGTIADFYRGAGIQHPSMISVLSMQIPLPHIKVQEEIVKILDSFTNLIDALNEELSLRQKQFEYYREKLLTFDDKSLLKPINEIGTLFRGNGLQKKDFVDEGVGCIHYGQIYTKLGFSLSKPLTYVTRETAKPLTKVRKGDLVIACTSENIEDVCKSVVWEGEEEIVTGGHACVLRHNENPRYIGYFFQTHQFFMQTKQYAYGAKVIDIKTEKLGEILIPVPSLAIQLSIVEKLDAFESLISSLKEEIALRQMQYGYYREKLLTFD